ncbi:helix-turn-helix domain-containing protein [Actinocatenispora rupis]|uniref:Transcriptional regulator n=1 Tax=Actinocatenispora rupis TaxID=519421 RepID=A0A8J3J6A2_9ACTN|nr:helix-turn-helix transcriptional regulator [Actinocatenispora rupis]GID14903.1 transcriptional regulator [Actinocatenispora rupis]
MPAKPREHAGSTFWLRRLGAELRKLREQSGMTADQAGAEMEWNRQKIWRIEKGTQEVLRTWDVQNMCKVYGAADSLTEALIGLCEKAKTGDWWQSFSEVIPRWFNVYLSLEEAATSIDWYTAELVPGLLQTDNYARVVFNTAGGAEDSNELTRRAKVRVQRQAALTRLAPDPPALHVVLNEAVIRRPVGGASVMAEQLRALLQFGALPNVTMRIFPFSAGQHGGMNGGEWVLLRFPQESSEPETVFHEALNGAAYLTKEQDVMQYKTVQDDLVKRSLDEETTKELIARAVKEFEET